MELPLDNAIKRIGKVYQGNCLFWYAIHCSTEDVLTHSPWTNGRLSANDIFICVFVIEKFCILINFSLNFGLKGPNDNNPALDKP